MKKILAILILCTTFLVGCNTDKAYKDAMNAGKEALTNNKYDVALNQFDLALQEKKDDDEATLLYNQTENFINGKNKYKECDYSVAIGFFNKVIDESKGSKILIDESVKMKEKAEKEKKLDSDIAQHVTSAQNYFESGNYELSIKDIKLAQELMGNMEKYKTEKKALNTLKSNCEHAINKIAEEKKEAEKKAAQEAKEKENNKSPISEAKAIKLLEQYIASQVGYTPNGVELYETVDNKYHFDVRHYENGPDGPSQTFGWFWMDMYTGEIIR